MHQIEKIKVNEWIPANILPDSSIPVLVFDTYLGIRVARFTGIFKINPLFESCDNASLWFKNVKFWMALPSFPE